MKEKIKKILAEIKEKPGLEHSLSDTSNILNDVRLDSLQMISFILKIEEACGIEFNFDAFDVSHLQSINLFCKFIMEQKSLKANERLEK
jgi:acyl carrier protein